MRIALVVGHSRLQSGLYTSADGTKFGGINEYKYNKWMYRYIAKYLRKAGHEVDVIICPEKVFKSSVEEKYYKLNKIMNGMHHLVVELHLNADGSGKATGSEVLYDDISAKKYADSVAKNLSAIFVDRGVKKRDDLYMLKACKSSIIVETFFCTNKEDCKKGKQYKTIGKAIADGIMNA